mmetsp:Transcript_7790/g.9650  ORF Transcript_7790/g.9650 Transcript_7790/m.9650 type:complete len:604 (+) Transcript_7790:463-2274(+)
MNSTAEHSALHDDEEQPKFARMNTLHSLLENHKQAIQRNSDSERAPQRRKPIPKIFFGDETSETSDGLASESPDRSASVKKNELSISGNRNRSKSSDMDTRPQKPDFSTSLSQGKANSFANMNANILTSPIPLTQGKEVKKKKRIFWKRRSQYSETDYIELGRILVNDVRIESNPYQKIPEFILSVQLKSQLLVKFPFLSKQDQELLFYSYFEQELPPYSIDESTNFLNVNNCTIFQLLQTLLLDITNDQHFTSVFLLSYRSLLEPVELMELLIYRAFGRPTGAGNFDSAMQGKVLQFICCWVEQFYPYDFSGDQHMLYMLSHTLNFLDTLNVRKNIVMKHIGHWITYTKAHKIQPMLKQNSKLKLAKQNPSEVAKQLTIAEFDIFRSIKPSEFAHQNWCSEDKDKTAPNILRMINQFNSISNWAASEILKKKTPKARAVLLNRFIVIAEESRALRNYNAVMSILSGLQSAPIYRLQHTWNLLPDESWDIWDSLNHLMSNDNNYANYRKLIKDSEQPSVPYIGVFLTDLVFIEESQPDYITNTNLINVTKLELTASVLFLLETCKRGEYNITPIPSLEACLLAIPKVMTEEEQKEKSLQLEPC